VAAFHRLAGGAHARRQPRQRRGKGGACHRPRQGVGVREGEHRDQQWPRSVVDQRILGARRGRDIKVVRHQPRQALPRGCGAIMPLSRRGRGSGGTETGKLEHEHAGCRCSRM
jgi:hypothetical protein